jgi:hypothetical protein
MEAGMGTATREIHLSSHMTTPIADDALGALKELAAEGRSLVMLVSGGVFLLFCRWSNFKARARY